MVCLIWKAGSSHLQLLIVCLEYTHLGMHTHKRTHIQTPFRSKEICFFFFLQIIAQAFKLPPKTKIPFSFSFLSSRTGLQEWFILSLLKNSLCPDANMPHSLTFGNSTSLENSRFHFSTYLHIVHFLMTNAKKEKNSMTLNTLLATFSSSYVYNNFGQNISYISLYIKTSIFHLTWSSFASWLVPTAQLSPNLEI